MTIRALCLGLLIAFTSGATSQSVARAQSATRSGDEDSGAAFVFTRSGSTWQQQAYLKARDGSTWTQRAFLKADHPEESDEFGFCVALSAEFAVVGSYIENSIATGINNDPWPADNSALSAGAVYVY